MIGRIVNDILNTLIKYLWGRTPEVLELCKLASDKERSSA